MKWLLEYRTGCVVLTNASCVPYEIADRILDNAINDGLAVRDTVRIQGFAPFRGYDIQPGAPKLEIPWLPVPGDTIWRDDWSKYQGTYRMKDGGGITFTWYARLARWFGYRTPKVIISRNGNRLCLNEYNGSEFIGERALTEHMQGLFFTTYGEALDFTKAMPTYRNIGLEK